MINRRDVQIAADIRLMALSLRKLCGASRDKAPVITGMTRVIHECDRIIAAGPSEFHHITAEAASPEVIALDLRQMAYGRRRG
ncbi:hypothetical protein M2341_002026 [Sphingobium sp. B7D2B]|uniref:hypothetical protein n=1 Tax=Sphingobium sp. B7D2B TaxID=2940583 RepID=UPI0022248754|nr:hypothetical protein [Sphingobium sp. B7D2B]MCW2366579.1 hypothetical protein [Sphingobium sp. B7D2B]